LAFAPSACAGYHAQGVLRQGGVACLQAFLKVLLHVARGLQGGGAVVALDAQGFACVWVHGTGRSQFVTSFRKFTEREVLASILATDLWYFWQVVLVTRV
jgi:hypothetical protein